MNGAMGENGLVWPRLIFRTIWRFPIQSSDSPNQKERVEAIISANTEMNSIVGELCVQKALTKNISPAAYHNYTNYRPK